MKVKNFLSASLTGLLFLLVIAAQAQVPPVINHQGQLLDADGNPADGNFQMDFAIFDVASGGTALYTETQNVTVANGIYNVYIGSVTPIPQDLFDASPPARFLEVTVNGTVLSPRRPFASVPYAFKAGNDGITAVTAGDGLTGGGSDGEVTLSIANGGVTSAHIHDGTITAADLGTNSVGSEEIAQDAVGSSEIADNAVGSSELADFIDLGEASVSNGDLQIYSSFRSTRTVELDIDPATDLGRIRVFNNDGGTAVKLGTNSEGAGLVEVFGPNGTPNIRLTSLTGHPNKGYIYVYDENGDPKAGIYVSSDVQGIVWGDRKNFRMPHPHMANKEIWYTAIEGPEAAAYLRGTGQLVDGRAEITFPEHFQIVANAKDMTVYVTPADVSSLGLAVTSKRATGFEVQELYEGRGNYDFDWEVQSVRKGHEDFRVLRSKAETNAAADQQEAAAARE